MKQNCFLLILFFVLSTPVIRAWQGEGISQNPYLIESKDDLAQLATNVNAGQSYSGSYFELTADIDLQNTEWTPIGNDTYPFKGVFDGKNHIISNLLITVSSTVNGVGLFGGIESGTLTNLGIKTATITNKMQNVGILVGVAKGNPLSKIENCYVDNGILTMTGSVGQYGIFVGRTFNGTISNCYVANSQLITTNQTAGGFAGSVNGAAGTTFNNCYIASTTISGAKAGTLQGVFCGTTNANHNAVFNNCYAAKIDEYNYIGTVNSKQVYKEGSTTLSISLPSDLSGKLYLENPAFANSELSWKLNTNNGSITNNGFWSHNGSHPIFADINHIAVYKAGIVYNAGTEGSQLYTTGSVPQNFTAIDLRSNYDAPDYATMSDIMNRGSSNKLIYLPSDAMNIPIAWKNIIKGATGTATGELELIDNAPFFCPEEFTATKATYSRSCYTDGGWETIILPFAVKSFTNAESGISVAEEYLVEGYATENTPGSVTFKFNPVDLNQPDTWLAGIPYIMKYNAGQIIEGNQNCVFEGQGKIAVSTHIEESPFKGTYQSISGTGKYLLAADGTYFGKGGENATIPPFRAYIEPANPNEAPARFGIEHGNSGTTNIESQPKQNSIYAANGTIIINQDRAQVISIYGIDGQLIYRSMLNEGSNTINGLAKGIYIVNSQKIIIQ